MLVPVLIALESLAVAETCPAAVDVEARVRSILHLQPEQRLAESFVVERHEAGLYVVLRGADASVIGERTLPLEGSCDELAQAAAVVLSAWLTDVHPDFAGALPPRPEPEPEPAPAEPQPPTVPAPRARSEPRRVPPTHPPSQPHRFDAGLAGGADLTDGTVALAGLASVGYGAEERGFGFVALAVASPLREETREPGVIGWWRWPLLLGPTYRVSTPSLSGDLSLGPVVAWLYLEGSAFDTNNTQNIVAWGAHGTLKISGRSRPLAPFGLISLQFYPADATAYVRNLDEAEWPIPRFSFVGAVGLRFAH